MQKLAVLPWESLLLAGLSRDKAAAQQTARNKICNNKFPFPLRVIAGKKVVLLADVYKSLGIDITPASIPVEAKEERRRRGRPPKKNFDAASARKGV